jgi:hypothetical protein
MTETQTLEMLTLLAEIKALLILIEANTGGA